MMTPVSSLALLLLASLLQDVSASPTKTIRARDSLVVIPLEKRGSNEATQGGSLAALQAQNAYLQAKYYNNRLILGGDSSNLTKRATGTLSLDSNYAPQAWSGLMTVGTPGQTLQMDFDTGSADIWSRSYLANGATSSTAQDQNKPFTIAYGGGTTASGENYLDKVTVAGLTAVSQSINTAQGFSPGDSDGIFGMAYQALSREQAVPFVKNLKTEVPNQISNAVFGFRLGSYAQNSELFIGGTDTSRLYSPLTYSSVTTQAYWQIALQGITVGATTILSVTDNVQCIIDTGSTAIQGPPALVEAFHAAIPTAMTVNEYFTATGQTQYVSSGNDGYYAVPCYGQFYEDIIFPRQSLITFTFGGQAFVLPWSALTATGIVGSDTLNGAYYCSSSVYGGPSPDGGDTLWTVGDAFLLNTYAEFDFDQNRVGFSYAV